MVSKPLISQFLTYIETSIFRRNLPYRQLSRPRSRKMSFNIEHRGWAASSPKI